MAEIKIEKKKTIWPWVLLGLVIVALAAYFLFFKEKNNDTIALRGDETHVTASSQNAVDDYIGFVEKDTTDMSLDHEYTHDALVKLVNATEETANKNDVNVTDNLSKVRTLAEKITQNENSTTHADAIKEAATISSNALITIQQAKFPDLQSDVEDLMVDAKDVDASDLTLDQKGTVKGFFKSAAEVLKKMN